MATMVLARHGRTTANTSGVLAGRSKGVHLDDRGAEQARAAGERLAGLAARGRRHQPARAVPRDGAGDRQGPGAGPKVASERGLLECDYGSWTGRELKTLAKEPMWKTVQAHPSAAVFPDGESMADMSARAVAAARRWDARVEAEHGADAVWVAVSHGDVIKAILADALGIHLDALPADHRRPGLPVGGALHPAAALRDEHEHVRRRPLAPQAAGQEAVPQPGPGPATPPSVVALVPTP